MKMDAKSHETATKAGESRQPSNSQEASQWTPQQSSPSAALQRANSAHPSVLQPSDILHLQRTVGNQAVQRLLKRDHAIRNPSQAPLPSIANGVVQAKRQAVGNGEASSDAIRPNHTGLPDQIKSGVENLSGYSMDDVNVHYNSEKPAQIQAHAYAQGTDIYLSRGQEKHLPHEAWHVVQQKQGRAKATKQLMAKRVLLNDERRLEHEADVMGDRSAAFEPGKSTNKQVLKTTSALGQGSTTSYVVQGRFYVDVIGDDGKVDQVDLESVSSIAELEKLIWQMPDDELNDEEVRIILHKVYATLKEIESNSFGAKALSFGLSLKEAPSKWFSSISDSAKSTFGFGMPGTDDERSSLTESMSSRKGAHSKQLGRDLKNTAIDTVMGQGLSQGASLALDHSVPGISMVVSALRTGQLIFRGKSAMSPIDLGVTLSSAKAKLEGYEEVSGDPVSSKVRKAIKTLAKAQYLRGGSKLGSAATGTLVGIGVGAALTAPIGAVPGAIVGAIIGSISGLIASTGIEKGTRDMQAEKSAVRTLVTVILTSNEYKGRRLGPTRDRSVGYGSTDSSTITTSTHSDYGQEKGEKESRTSRHQSPQSNSNNSYQYAQVDPLQQINMDALAAYSALMQLGVSEESLRSMQDLEQTVKAQLNIG